MNPETVISFNVNALSVLIAIISIFSALLAIVWKAKKEIADTIRNELEPIRKEISLLRL